MRNLTKIKRIFIWIVTAVLFLSFSSGCALKEMLATFPEGEEEEEPPMLSGTMTETQMTVDFLQREYAGEEVEEEEILTVSDARASVIVSGPDDTGEEDDLIDFPASCYAYSVLPENRKKIYVEIYRCLCDRAGETLLSSTDPDEVDLAFNSVMIDHPEIFYVSGYRITKTTLAGKVTSIDFTGRYTMSDREIEKNREIIEDYVNQFLKGAPDTDDEFEKVKYIFDYLVDHTEFDLNSENNQNVCSVFVTGRTVCQGYSMAAKYLADELGVFATISYGYANGTGHAWNIFRINGVYCHVDVTWGDTSYHDAYDGSDQAMTDYVYLGANDALILERHELANFIRMPECTSLSQYYFVRMGRYFDEPDRRKMMRLFQEAYTNGEEMLTIKCSNEAVFEEISEDLFEDREVFRYLQGNGKARYVRNTKELTISFLLSV